MLKKLVKNNYLVFLMLITLIMIFSSSIFSKKIFAHNATNIQKKTSSEILEVKNKKFNFIDIDCKKFSLLALNRINLFNLGITINPNNVEKLNDITQKCCDIINSESSNKFKSQKSIQESSNTNLVKIVNNLKKVIVNNSIRNSIEINDTFTNWNQYFENCCVILLSSLIECSETYSDDESESILIFMSSQITGMLSDMLIKYILSD
ncbi:hypothetical protein AYWB_127 [Aster yellows witches'-broom phytoplasma AYWB]|uniref:Uncharacterized protein n=1 Tax=Aster yellows witches'-broom phytoplasma (strain AYWB) TaxID=322098 RepID=Q2NJZ9_AYWBP|nr:hypothetical protein [Aster yellows witches'-broom phytoplasma]ABC65244.1 hypothetical protein AYWB_127 [Aster yellows witches'-broom phytoplasma AYWB]